MLTTSKIFNVPSALKSAAKNSVSVGKSVCKTKLTSRTISMTFIVPSQLISPKSHSGSQFVVSWYPISSSVRHSG